MNVLWHDLECGGYDADLPLWRELVAETGGPVLDVGAGTGRVACALAADGVEVVALDADAELLATLRARDGAVETVVADARDFDLAGREFAAVIVPMQTLQLLDDRAGFYRCARAALRDGGLLAAALADAFEGYVEGDDAVPPVPDMREVDGVVYASRPIALRDEEDGVVIVRIREVVRADGTHSSEVNEITLRRIDAAGVATEAAAHGFEPLAPRAVAQTEEYVGSEVVVLRAA
ncbi:MAG TPA: class I SAM-dependent methyltransferase [Solirubrobacteraceae bacterium]